VLSINLRDFNKSLQNKKLSIKKMTGAKSAAPSCPQPSPIQNLEHF